MEPFDIDPSILADVVRRMPGRAGLAPGRWGVEPIAHRIINRGVTAGLYRVAGRAGDWSKPWSLVVKVLRRAADDPSSAFNASDDPAHWNYWRREALVYTSGLLDGLPDGLVAPRCFAVSEPALDSCWLWMEDIDGAPATGWPLERLGLAAHHLGRMQGQFLAGRALPNAPWFSQRWIRWWVPDRQGARLELVGDAEVWRHPSITRIFPRSLADQALRLWQDHEVLLAALERAPRTLCHFDFWPRNLFDRRGETVLIDWSQAGHGAPGEDIANLVMDSVWMLLIDSAAIPRLERLVLEGYVAGLRDAGWAGDERLVRFVYAAVAAARFGLLAGRVLQLVRDEQQHAALEQTYERSIDHIAGHRGATVEHALSLAQEARALLPFL